jgi:hypothetical protein
VVASTVAPTTTFHRNTLVTTVGATDKPVTFSASAISVPSRALPLDFLVKQSALSADASFGPPEKLAMFDELDRLLTSPHLVQLLAHYAQRGEADREAWQPRLNTMEGVAAPELTKLHGELLAFGWAEQNTGQVPVGNRVTPQGQRALRQAQAPEQEDEGPPAPQGRAERGRAIAA